MARHSHLAFLAASVFAFASLFPLPALAAESIAIKQFNRLVLKRNYTKSAAVLKAAAKAGDAEAQFRLGNLYRIGLGVTRDETRARDLLQSAVAAGNPKAKRLLSRLGKAAPARTEQIARSGKGDLQLFVPAVISADTDGAGNSWLARAAARGLIGVLNNLATAETDLRSLLLTASERGQNDTALLLVRAGTPINTVDRQGRTALMLSAASNSPNLTANLVTAGADTTRQDKDGDTALHYAIRRCNIPAAISLLQNATPLSSMPQARPYLHLALQLCADAQVVEEIISHVDIDAVDSAGRSALWHAAYQGQTDIAKQLIARHANVSLMDNDAMTPLHAAASRCHAGVMQVLLQSGAGASAVTRDGNTPLMLAGAANCTEGLALLIAANANLNAANNQGDTALLIATSRSSENALELLLAAGAEPNVRNMRRETAAAIAARLGWADFVALLSAK